MRSLLVEFRSRYPRLGLTASIHCTIMNEFAWALYSGRNIEHAMTMTFVLLILIECFKAYSFRSDHRSVLNQPFANRWLNLSIA